MGGFWHFWSHNHWHKAANDQLREDYPIEIIGKRDFLIGTK